MKYTIAMAVMATIVISSSNKIEDVRMNLCDYNGITKIAEVANTNSDLFHANLVSSAFRLQPLENRIE